MAKGQNRLLIEKKGIQEKVREKIRENFREEIRRDQRKDWGRGRF